MAETVGMADNLTLLGENIQSKVGQTLIGATAVAEDTKKQSGSTGALSILDTLADLQQQTINKITLVWETLQAGVKFEKNEARLVRQEKKETDLERKKKGGDSWFDSALKGELPGESGVSTFLGGFLAGKWGKLLTTGGLLLFMKGIFKRSVLALIGGWFGSLLIDKLNTDQGTKSEMTNMLTVGLGLTLFGKKGIVAGLLLFATMGITSLYEWMSGQKRASEFSTFNWGHIALTGPALMIAAKVAGLLGTGAGGALTIGGLLVGWPVVIAASLAIALAAGIGYVSAEMQKYRQGILKHLEKITSMTQDSFNEKLAEEEASWKSKVLPESMVGAWGGDLTTQQNQLVATKEAAELAEGKGEIDSKMARDLVDTSSQMLDATLDVKKFDAVMQDDYKMEVMRKTAANLMRIVATQKLSVDDSDIINENISRLMNHIEASAKRIVADEQGKGLETAPHLVELATGNFTDKFERHKEIMPKIKSLTELVAAQQADLKILNDTPRDSRMRGYDKVSKQEFALGNELAINKKKLFALQAELDYGHANVIAHGDMTSGWHNVDIEKALAAGSLDEAKKILERARMDNENLIKDGIAKRSLTKDDVMKENWSFIGGNTTAQNNSTLGNVVVYDSGTQTDTEFRSNQE